MKKLCWLVMVFAAGVLAGCGGGSSSPQNTAPAAAPQAEAPVVVKLATVQNEQHPYAVMSYEMKEQIEKRSKGNLVLELYHNGALGDERAIVEGMQFNTIGMGITTSASAGNFLPDISVFEMPFLFATEQEARKAVDGPVGQKILAKFADIGLKGIGIAEQGFRNLTNSKRPVKTVNDIQGLKIRVMENELYLDMFKALGANATPMAWGECLTALQQKTIDGQENPVVTVYTFHLFESQKYMSMTHHTYSAGLVLMSKQFYDSLKPEYQTIINEVVKEAIKNERATLDKQVSEQLQALRKEGMEIVENPDLKSFRDKLGAINEKYGKRFEAYLAEIAANK
jgi:tripartite ATP-independent transporter DctP family solute receptor